MMVEFSTVDDAPVRLPTDGSDPADGGMAYSGLSMWTRPVR